MAYGEVINCQNTCTDDSNCIADNCVGQYAICYGGDIYGAAECPALHQCAGACKNLEDADCIRNCMKASTQEAGVEWWDLKLCLLAACPGAKGQEKEDCEQNQLKDEGLCTLEALKCGI